MNSSMVQYFTVEPCRIQKHQATLDQESTIPRKFLNIDSPRICPAWLVNSNVALPITATTVLSQCTTTSVKQIQEAAQIPSRAVFAGVS